MALKKRPYTLAILGAILLGAFVRLFAALTADFPLNDGGMFYMMAQDILDAGYALPHTTSYNVSGIPFAYPPLGFYLAAGLTDLTGASLLDVLRVLPPILTALTVPAFYLLSREILQSRLQVVIAVFAFAFIPTTFVWLVMGGGLTRSIGLLSALLLLHQVFLLYTRQQTKYIITSVLAGTATVLSHPVTAWFACYSIAVLFLFYRRNWKNIRYSLLVAVGVITLTAPWWVTLVARHGLSPLLSASRSNPVPILAALIKPLFLTGEPYVSLLLVLGFLGVIACLAKKQRFLPVWLLVALVLNAHSSSSEAPVPFAMLIAVAVDEIVLPAFNRSKTENVGGALKAPILIILLIYAFVSAAAMSFADGTLMVPLSSEERQVMTWIERETPEDTHFLVLSPADIWEGDATAEWFPALTQRESINTVQGYEWLPNKTFENRRLTYLTIRKCLEDGLACLEQEELSYDYIYIDNEKRATETPEKYYPALIDALKASSDYKLVYETKHISLFERLQPASE